MKMTNLQLAPGAGKTKATIRWIAAQAREGVAPDKNTSTHRIVYVTSREEIEACDIARFVSNFHPDRTKKELRDMHRNVIFTVHGYDEQPEELYEIPEVRRYYSLLHKVHPCWLFMSDPESPALSSVIFSIIENVSVVRTPAWLHVDVPDADMRAFFLGSVPFAAHLHYRSGISKRRGLAHLNSMAAILNIKDI